MVEICRTSSPARSASADVTGVDWVLGRRAGTGISGVHVAPYIAAQTIGAVAGAILANAMFELPLVEISTNDRASTGHGIGEIVATAGLVALIFLLARTDRPTQTAAAVGAYIGAAYWFTSSTSFANPAVTIGRVFTDTFAGIAPGSIPLYIAAQVIGAAIGLALVVALVPNPATAGESPTLRPSTVPAIQETR